MSGIREIEHQGSSGIYIDYWSDEFQNVSICCIHFDIFFFLGTFLLYFKLLASMAV